MALATRRSQLQNGITRSRYYPNATQANFSYDALNRLQKLENLGPSNEILSTHDYVLGPTGNRLQVTESGGRVVNYQYDPLYRLTQEAVTDPGAGNSSLDFSYDAVGNRLTQVLNGATTAYTYDDNDRLLTEGAVGYTYDANGNTLTKTGPDGVVTSVYDAENRLVSVTAGGSTLTYTYDDSGIKVQASVDGVVTDYLVDANRDYAQVLEELDSTGQATVQYRYGDDLISQVRGGQSSFYHYDGLGSTRALSDGAGVLANTYQYRPFGELAQSSGTISNHYLFAGEQLEPRTGLYYLRARWMGPGNGRFTQQDTWSGAQLKPITLNRYLYGYSDPVSNIDPSGKFGLLGIASVASVVALGATYLIYVNNLITDIDNYEKRHYNEPLKAMLIGEIKSSIPQSVLLGQLLAILPYWDLVKSKGTWDYKNRTIYLKVREKEALGNYAFGVTSAAWADGATGGMLSGIPDVLNVPQNMAIDLAQRGAGAYQEYKQPKHYRASFGHWYDFWNPDSYYGDSPQDSANIYMGAQYYFSNQTRFQPNTIKDH